MLLSEKWSREKQRDDARAEAAAGRARDAGEKAGRGDLARRWFAAMARRHHADAGGSDERMKVVFDGLAVLEELLRGRT